MQNYRSWRWLICKARASSAAQRNVCWGITRLDKHSRLCTLLVDWGVMECQVTCVSTKEFSSVVTNVSTKEFSSVVLLVLCHFNEVSIFTNIILIITASAVLNFIFYIFYLVPNICLMSDVKICVCLATAPLGARRAAGDVSWERADSRLRRHAPHPDWGREY